MDSLKTSPTLQSLPQLPRISHPAPNVTADQPQTSGTLQIVDHFTATVDENGPLLPDPRGGPPQKPLKIPHGIEVTNSAQATGLTVPITTSEFKGSGDSVARTLLAFPDMTPEATLKALDAAAMQDQVFTGLGAAMSIQDGLKAGTTNSVMNFSLHASAANTTEHLYQDVRAAWQPAPESMTDEQQQTRFRGQQISDNLARAWNINPSDLSSTDPNVSGPARAQFQQNLIDRTSASNETADVQGARQLFSGIVDAYEANRNSVVVAAGNNGDLLSQMKGDNGGRDLKTPEGFFDNILAAPNATTVGATGPGAHGIEVADYSSRYPQVDLHAWGLAPRPPDVASPVGSSFGAPRVAVMMQEMHLRHPDASSAEVERMVAQRCFPGSVPMEQEGCTINLIQ